MEPFPHRYSVSAAASAEGEVTLEGPRLPALGSAPPAEFGGPGNRWSPETLLVAAVADCFVLTFRAIASAQRLPWISLTCEGQGTVERPERVTQFTGFELRARLRVPEGVNREKAQQALERAERTCLVTNSLKAGVRLETEVQVENGRES